MAWSIDTTSTCCRQNDRPNAEDASILPVWHSETTEFSVFASNRIYFEFNAPPTIHYREILSVKWGEILLNNERYVLHTMHRYSHCFRWDLGLLKFCRGINNVTQTCEQNYVKMTSMIRSLSLARQKEKKKQLILYLFSANDFKMNRFPTCKCFSPVWEISRTDSDATRNEKTTTRSSNVRLKQPAQQITRHVINSPLNNWNWSNVGNIAQIYDRIRQISNANIESEGGKNHN